MAQTLKLEIITRRPDTTSHSTPLLFVHGAWHGAWCWDVKFLPYFARHGYEAYALSLRGHGSSQNNKPLRLTRISDYVKDVAQAAGTLARPPVLIGHSMGGFIVQKVLEQREAPAAVLLASIPPKGALPSFLRFTARHPLAMLRSALTLSAYPMVGSPQLTREGFFSADLPEAQVLAYFGRVQNEAFMAALDITFLNLPRPERVKTPVLVLGAAQDALFTNDEVEDTARAYGVSEEVIGRALKPFPERARNAVTKALQGFLEGLRLFRTARQFVLYAVLSLFVWLGIVLFYWVFFFAYRVHVPYFMVVPYVFLTAVGASIPTPGMVGGFHYFSKLGMVLVLGLAPGPAAGMTLVFHAVQIAVTCVLGYVILAREGLTLFQLRRMGESEKP